MGSFLLIPQKNKKNFIYFYTPTTLYAWGVLALLTKIKLK